MVRVTARQAHHTPIPPWVRIGLALLLIPVMLLAPHPSRAATPTRVGYVAVSSDAGIYIAMDKGYFKEQGLEISLERLSTGSDQMALLGAGQLNIATGGVSPTLFNAVSRGLPIAVVADKGSLRKGFGFTVLVVRKALVDSGQFKEVRDLRGRTVAAINAVSPLLFGMSLLFKRAGMSLTDVRIEYIDISDQVAAMANGKIDAAVMVEPFATAAESRGIGKIITPFDQVMPDFPIALIFYNTRWAREHQDDARRWMVAYVKALRYYNRSLKDRAVREDVITILSTHTAVKDRAVYDKMIWPGLNPDGQIAPRSLLDYERWLVNKRQVGQFLPPGRFIDSSYVEYATRTLGPFHP